MLVRVLVLLLASSFPFENAYALSQLPGFLGAALMRGAVESLELRAEIQRTGWELPEFREFPTVCLTAPGDYSPHSGWLHPGTRRFYEFMDYMVFKKPGIMRATLALNCAEQDIT